MSIRAAEPKRNSPKSTKRTRHSETTKKRGSTTTLACLETSSSRPAKTHSVASTRVKALEGLVDLKGSTINLDKVKEASNSLSETYLKNSKSFSEASKEVASEDREEVSSPSKKAETSWFPSRLISLML